MGIKEISLLVEKFNSYPNWDTFGMFCTLDCFLRWVRYETYILTWTWNKWPDFGYPICDGSSVDDTTPRVILEKRKVRHQLSVTRRTRSDNFEIKKNIPALRALRRPNLAACGCHAHSTSPLSPASLYFPLTNHKKNLIFKKIVFYKIFTGGQSQFSVLTTDSFVLRLVCLLVDWRVLRLVIKFLAPSVFYLSNDQFEEPK